MKNALKNPFVILVAMLFFISCGRGYRSYELDKTNFDTKTLQTIESDTKIILPVGARGLNFYYKPPVDPAYLAKIEIPLNAKEDMIKTLSAIKNDENIHTMDSLGTKMNWWIPKGVKLLVDRQTIIGNGNYLHVMLTEEDSSVILYIEWWVI